MKGAIFAGAEDQGELLAELEAIGTAVELRLSEMVSSNVSLVQQVGQHTLEAGGKRLRPALVVLAAKSTGLAFDLDRAVRLAACLEAIHMATLIHDDVIDHSDHRRGRPTAAKLFGNTGSILAGDVLLAKSMQVLATDGDLSIIRTVSSTVVELSEGEALELQCRGNFELTEDEHIRILSLKTATFVACCCRVGAILAGASADQTDALGVFGHEAGLAFQIVDDLLDFRADPKITGKPRAVDFREGCATLPLIYLRDKMDPAELVHAKKHFGNGVTDADLVQLHGWMEQYGAYAAAESRAKKSGVTALSALDVIPQNPARKMLENVVPFVLHRVS